jgi:hypothetical protein
MQDPGILDITIAIFVATFWNTAYEAPLGEYASGAAIVSSCAVWISPLTNGSVWTDHRHNGVVIDAIVRDAKSIRCSIGLFGRDWKDT